MDGARLYIQNAKGNYEIIGEVDTAPPAAPILPEKIDGTVTLKIIDWVELWKLMAKIWR